MNKRAVVGVAVVIAGLGFFAYQIYQRMGTRTQANGGRREMAVAVETAPVARATIREVGRFTGSLYPLSEYVLAPKIAGRLKKIWVNIGDPVRAEQLMAVLDDDEYHQQVIQAKAALEVAKATLQERANLLDNAKREHERAVALRQKKIASEAQLDAAASEYRTQQAKLRVATAQVSQEEAALKMAEVRLSYTRIEATDAIENGHRVVGERFVDEGAMLAANTPIVSILDIGRLIAAIYVIEQDYPKIQTGLEAVISTDAFPGKTFRGRIMRMAPFLKEKSREARVEVEIPNDEMLLKPGMFVRVDIQFAVREDALVVPVAALVKRNGIQGVYMADVKENRARFTPVTVGIVNDSQVEIVDPPLTGPVVTLGHHLLVDGTAIILPQLKPAGGEKP